MENNNTPVSQPTQTYKAVDTYSYKGWLNSDSFFKRCFSIFGYGLLGQLMILVPIYIFIIIVVVVISLFTQ